MKVIQKCANKCIDYNHNRYKTLKATNGKLRYCSRSSTSVINIVIVISKINRIMIKC